MAINLAKILAKNFAKFGKPIGVVSATLTLYTTGTRTPGALSAGTNPTSVAYPCKGFIEDFELAAIGGTLVTKDDRRISIFGASLPAGIVPKEGSTVTIKSVTYTIRSVIGDGVDAVYECVSRK